jgi:hypothetical protein
MSSAGKNYRSRTYSWKWHLCDDDGKACPDLGWFYEVKKGLKTIRVLPANLDSFNDLLAQAEMQPVGPHWTDKVPLGRVTDRTEIPKVSLPTVATATVLEPVSPQKRLVKLIFDYWTGQFPDPASHSVRSDQGGYWGAAKGSPARVGTGLYTKDGKKGRGTWMARPDVAVLELHERKIPYIVEVEVGEHIKPKVPAGVIGACNMWK